MASNLALNINIVILICTSVVVLGPVFYWLLTDARPEPSHR